MYKSKCKKAKAPLLAGLACQVAFLLQQLRLVGGVDGTRTRDPRRDRPVF